MSPRPHQGSEHADQVRLYLTRNRPNPAEPLPLHYQVQVLLRKIIRELNLLPGTALPAEQSMAACLDVSRTTLRVAVDQLIQDGLLRRRRGSGTFVVSAPAPEPETVGTPSFLGALWRLRPQLTTSLVSVRAIKELKEPALGVPPAFERLEHGVEATWLFLQGDAPVALETLYIGHLQPDELPASADDATLYARIEERVGRPITVAEERLTVTILAGATAQLIGLPAESEVVFVERQTFSDAQLIELRQSYVRLDALELHTIVPRRYLRP